MPSNSVILTVDDLRFKWSTYRNFFAYLVTVAVDNRGVLHVFETPGRKRVVHRPNLGKPAVWDGGHDGILAYRNVGEVPSVIAYSITLVRDRGRARAAGEILDRVRNSREFGDIVAGARAAAAAAWPATVALGFLEPVVGILANILKNLGDRPIDTVYGAKFFPADAGPGELTDRVAGAIFDATLQFSLFTAATPVRAAVEAVTREVLAHGSPKRTAIAVEEDDDEIDEAALPARLDLLALADRRGT